MKFPKFYQNFGVLEQNRIYLTKSYFKASDLKKKRKYGVILINFHKDVNARVLVYSVYCVTKSRVYGILYEH